MAVVAAAAFVSAGSAVTWAVATAASTRYARARTTSEVVAPLNASSPSEREPISEVAVVEEEIEDDPLDGEEGPGDDDLNQIAEAEVADVDLFADDEELLVIGQHDDEDDDDEVKGSGFPADDDAVHEEAAAEETTVALVEDDGDDEDVEAGLDVILKARLVSGDEDELEADDADDVDDDDDRHEATIRLLPKQANEFVCQSCFLVKHIGQLADDKKMLCRDCV